MKNSQEGPQDYYKFKSKQISHSQHLKDCKRVFDQLHRNQANTFTVRKRHLQRTHQKAHSLNKSKEQMLTQTPKYYQINEQPNQELPSIPSQQYLNPKSISEPKSNQNLNIDIIKKMLQINSSRNRDKNNKGYSSKNYNQINYRSEKFYDDQNDKLLFGESNEYKGTGRRNKITRLFDQSTQELQFYKASKYNRQSVLQKRNQQVQQQRRSRNRSQLKQKIQTPANSKLKSLPKQKTPSELMVQNRMNRTQTGTSTFSLTQYNFLSLQSYIRFIKAPEDIKQLNINFNFAPLRKLSPNEAWKNLDIKNAKMIENLLHNLFVSIQDNVNQSEQYVQDFCRLYFNNYEKAKLQIILKEHYFKLFAFRLNPIFVYQRIAIYFSYILCQKKLLKNSWYSSKILVIVELLKNIYALIISIITQIQITKHTLQSLINITSSKTSARISIPGVRPISMSNNNTNHVNEAFQILRAVGQMQKYISQLQRNIQAIVQSGNVSELGEIAKILKQYLKEQGHAVGAKSYENFIKTQMLLSWRYLQVPPTPFLPPIKSQFKYTMVIDLDQTIIFYNKETKLLKFRPSLSLFFQKLQDMKFQIILFSSTSKSYADSMVKQIQKKNKIFQYRLYKQHLSLYQGKSIKDLRRLGRDMSKTIIIDDLSVNFSSCKQNGIQVTSWQGQREDRQLLIILTILIKLQNSAYTSKVFKQDEQNGYTDVRILLKNCKNKLQSMLQSYQVNEFME